MEPLCKTHRSGTLKNRTILPVYICYTYLKTSTDLRVSLVLWSTAFIAILLFVTFLDLFANWSSFVKPCHGEVGRFMLAIPAFGWLRQEDLTSRPARAVFRGPNPQNKTKTKSIKRETTLCRHIVGNGNWCLTTCPVTTGVPLIIQMLVKKEVAMTQFILWRSQAFSTCSPSLSARRGSPHSDKHTRAAHDSVLATW